MERMWWLTLNVSKHSASRKTRRLGVAEAGRHYSKFSVAVTCLFGHFAAGKGILSSVAIPQLSRPFACTTTLECHSRPPVTPRTAFSLTSPSNIRNCPQSVCRSPPLPNERPRHTIVPSATLHYHNGTCFFRFSSCRQ